MKTLSSQKYVLDSGLLTTGFNCILQMPTGSGKTWLAEHAIRDVISKGGRAMYLAPVRALASQIYARWQDQFGVPVGIFTGEYGAGNLKYPTSFKDARVLIMTPERLDACTRMWRPHWQWIPQIDLIVADEIHHLGDGYRGARLEGALARMLRLNPFGRVLGLSATLGNPHELATWLDGVSYQSSDRPVPLSWQFRSYKSYKDKPSILGDEITKTAQSGGNTLVFVQSRRRAEQLSNTLKQQGIRCHHHHAGLKTKARQKIEERFGKNQFDALIATPTLEMGVNLPVKKVILYDTQYFNGTEFVPLSVNQAWQRVGRAGRLGFDDTGEAVVLMPAWDKSSKRYEQGRFESINSQLHDERALAEQIIAEVSSGLARTHFELRRALAGYLGGHQNRLKKIDSVIATMCQANMLVEQTKEGMPAETPHLRATRLGRIAARQLLLPATVLLFDQVLTRYPSLTFFDLLLVVASSEDFEPLIPVDFEELDSLQSDLAKMPTNLLQSDLEGITSTLGVSGRRLLSACKSAIIVREWTQGTDANSLAARNGCYETEVERLKESFMRLLPALSSTIPPAEVDNPDPDKDMIREKALVLTQMVRSGLNETQATVTLVPGVGPQNAMKLINAGIDNLEDLALADETLGKIPGISSKRIAQWIFSAEELLPQYDRYLFGEDAPFVDTEKALWPAGVDPYRLRRALDLSVKRLGGHTFRVTGGLDPHRVIVQGATQVCDCPDHGKGHLCKHVLSVRLFLKESSVVALQERIKPNTKSAKFDLLSLWNEYRPLRNAS